MDALRAIDRVARSIRANLKPTALTALTFVPIPPSKPVGHPEHDDRIAAIARAITGADARDLLVTREARDARHGQSARRDPEALRETLMLRAQGLGGPVQQIVLLDDVLTTGCSFTVCRDMLAEALPGIPIIGVFVARRVIDPSAGFDDLTF